MIIQKLLIAITLLTQFTIIVHSEEKIYGIGAAVTSNSSSLYLPINSTNYLFEPTLYLSSTQFKPDGASTSSDIKRTHVNFGFGIFKKSKLSNRTVLYYGSRFAIRIRNNSTNRTNSTSTESATSFVIEPTIGAEYYISKNFSLGINVGLIYENEKSKSKDVSGATISNFDSTNTFIFLATDILFRYHFK